MLRINNKDFIFTTSILMEADQIATYAPPEAGGLIFKLQTDKHGTPLTSIEDNFKSSVDGNLVMVSFPFLTNGNTMSGDYSVTTTAGVRLDMLFAASCVGNFMLVHLHGYRTRD